MKLKVSQIKPNPFKKEINGGKLNPETISMIRSNLKKLGLMGSIPVFKQGKNYHCVSHHHRVEAVKQEYGKSHEVEVVVHDYDKEKALRGMAVENLTQRGGSEVHEICDNLVMIRKFLKNENNIGRTQANIQRRPLEIGSTSHIAEWLNQTGKILSNTDIKEHLAMYDNLEKSIYDAIANTHRGNANRRKDGKTVAKSQAIILSSIDDKEEQKDLAKNMLSSRADRVRDQSKLLAQYKKLSSDDITTEITTKEKKAFVDEGWKITKEKGDVINVKRAKTDEEKERHKAVKQEIRSGEKDIADVEVKVVLPKMVKTAAQAKLDFLDSLYRVDLDKMIDNLSSLQLPALENLYSQITMWAENDFAPFMRELIEVAANKKENGEEVIFEIINEVKGRLKKK